MALDLVDKRDLSVGGVTHAGGGERRAGGRGRGRERPLEALVLEVMKRARASRLWLGCECRSEAGRRPVVAPCRNQRGTDFWRVLAGRQVAHDESCVFYRLCGGGRYIAGR